MNLTPIEWTDFSANPVKYRSLDGRVVWACEKISPGCANCYAEKLSHRYGGVRRAGEWNAAVMKTLTPFLDEAELRKMLTATQIQGRAVAGSKCFIGDMTDVFGEWVPDALLDRLFAVMALRSDVTWQVLTKRAKRMRAYFAVDWNAPLSECREARVGREAAAIARKVLGEDPDAPNWDVFWDWPLPNVWLGTSAEDQRRADERIPELLQTPAAVRFVSAEPLLGPINLAPWITEVEPPSPPIIDWLIPGGESGAGARQCDIAAIRSLVAQCSEAGVACFVKQLGARAVDGERPWFYAGGRYDPKGSKIAFWPADLRVRQFPSARQAEATVR